ncbi:exopolyphosphatase [Bacillus xiapuensis]|uniref:exopolyphosphatase n=1 Tax=Bacillus xiapuensis TaxID=2014075 RepID=UPI000C247A12|nr:exopolyphosphatase [Bacillus xiapuensis]
MNNKKTSIIDIGSNTVRLVIYRLDESSFEEIENVKAPIRLGKYLGENNQLSEEGILILADVLHNFKEILNTHHVEDVECAATAAVRQASNRDDIIEYIKNETGFTIRILTGQEEARYGLAAVTQTIAADDGLCVDIGGASTEITKFENRKPVASFSFPFGAVTLKERFLKEERMSEDEQKELNSYLQSELARFPWIHNEGGAIVAVGGSARNLANVDQIKREYPSIGLHGYEMSAKSMKELREELSVLSFEQLEKVDGLSKERADIILPALEVLYQLMENSKSKRMIISSRGLRDGVIMDKLYKLSANTEQEIKEKGTTRLLQSYQMNSEASQQVLFLTERLAAELQASGVLSIDEEAEFMLKQAAQLFNLGEYISSSSKSQHTFYLLTNSTFDGYTHKEKVQLSLLASFTNHSTLKQYAQPFKGWFSKEEWRQMREWGALLKLCYSFNSTKRSVVQDIKAIRKDGGLALSILCSKRCLAEKYQSEKQKRHLEKALQLPIDLDFIEKI